jgi:CBS domain-containing protein
VHDVADFLGRHAPFDALDPEALAALAATVEIEFFPRGAVVFAQGAAPAEHAWVVRTGSVELLDQGRVLDVLGEGELFGHPSMLSGLPTELAARAHEDALCYRLGRDATLPVLSAPAGAAWMARSLRDRPGVAVAADAGAVQDLASRRVRSLLRGAPLVVAPGASVREAARQMTDRGATCALVDLGDRRLGILTDRDLRSRVLAGDVPADAPVSAAMTPDAWVVDGERLGSEVLLEMLERGVRHVPVRDPDGRLAGVLDDRDLLAAEGRAPFRLRRALDTATDRDAVVRAGRALRPTLVALHESGLAARQVSSVMSIVADALVRRLLELAGGEHGPAPVPVAWLAMGSVARREASPGSDLDSALAWSGDDDDPVAMSWTGAVAAWVLDALAECGLGRDEHGVAADDARFARSAGAWRAALAGWAADPEQAQGLIYLGALLDARAVTGADVFAPVVADVRTAVTRPLVARLLGRLALAHRPPTGFLRGLVIEYSGDRRGRFDVKRGGLLPVVDVARWAGVAALASSAGAAVGGTTPERLRAARDAGVLSAATARTLEEAFDLFLGLRLGHHVARIREGAVPGDILDVDALTPLTRRYLREAFRAVAAVQRRVQAGLELPR